MDEYQNLLKTLEAQEQELQFERFDNEVALRLGLRLLEAAKSQSKAITIGITRNGQQLFHYAMAGTSIDNDEWVKKKSNVVTRYGHSSYYVGTRYRARNTTFEEAVQLDHSQYGAHGGAFPIIVRGVGLVGTVAVSGLPQAEDHELVVTVLRDVLRDQEPRTVLTRPGTLAAPADR